MKILSTILVVFISIVTLGYNGHIVHFEHITTTNGLPNNYSNCIIKDKHGFVWIGTNFGLARYDGNNLVVYKNIKNDTSSLLSNKIATLFEDQNQTLWIGTSDNGLCSYNRKTDSFVPHELGEKDSSASFYKGIIKIYQSSDGVMWVSTWGGLCFYDKKIQAFVCRPFSKSKRNTIQDQAFEIIEDQQGTLWFFTYGLYAYAYNRAKDEFEPIEIATSRSFMRRAVKTNDGLFLILGYGNGIQSFDPTKRRIIHTMMEPSIPSNNYRTGFQSPSGDLWLGSDGEGITIFDPRFSHATTLKNNPTVASSLSSNAIFDLYRDASGIVWVATFNQGICIYDPCKQKFELYDNKINKPGAFPSRAITSICQDSRGRIWLGTDGDGLWLFNKEDASFKSYTNNPADKRSISSNVVKTICEDNYGNLLLGTFNGGMCVFNPATGTCKRFTYSPTKPGIHAQSIWHIYKTSSGKILTGFLVHDGWSIQVFDDKNQTFSQEKIVPELHDNVMTMFEDSRHTVWIGALEAGVFALQPNGSCQRLMSKKDEKNSLSSNDVRAIFEDSRGIMWFGTEGAGLDSYDPRDGEWKHFTEANGLPSDIIHGILQDKHGFLWISTASGISKFNHRNQTFTNFDASDGLQGGSFLYNCSLADKDGWFYFGGTKGLNIFHPDSVKRSTHSPKILITNLSIVSKIVKPNDGSHILSKPLTLTDTLFLSHRHIMFSLEFTAMVFSNQHKVKYAYMLEGFDKKWNECGNERKATYTNINPGRYIFRVKATNSDRVWSTNQARLTIIIPPPYWQTWWFKTLIVCLVMMCFVLFYYIRLSRIKTVNKKLTAMVEERTLELAQNNELLREKTEKLELSNKKLKEHQIYIEIQTEELKAQTEMLNDTNAVLEERQVRIEEQAEELMVQKEELEAQRDQLYELNMTKDRLFSIIGHDLRNPFTAIQGYSELLILKFRNNSPEKNETQLGYIRDAAKDTLHLLNKLLDWSKSQRGSVHLDLKELDLASLLETELNVLENQANQKNIKIRFMILGQEYIVITDANIISTVMRNLVSNAIKFSNPGSSIHIILDFENKDSFMFSVTDQGVGMSPEKVKTLFDTNANRSTRGTAGEKGTGLGLLLCADFIAKLNGKIWVESTENVGTTFFFCIPARQKE